MVDISKQTHTTIIITTHYIEEARKADRVIPFEFQTFLKYTPWELKTSQIKVGLIRNGRILAEHPPDYLLQIHNESVNILLGAFNFGLIILKVQVY